ncbi:MAG: hypothetical protein Q8O57_08300, partial [Kiritimatiellota bacterium]|nr:hypothetical protein [Kiritimatiellota bacterium]
GVMLGTASAADRFWVGANGTWNNTANWSATSGGGGSAGVPGATDMAIFDGNGTGNCDIDANISVLGLRMEAGYTGTNTQSAAWTITTGTNGLIVSNGVFLGGAGNITVGTADASYFTLAGGRFRSTTNVFLVRSGFTISGGTFEHNNGTVTFGRGGGTGAGDWKTAPALVKSGGAIFYRVQFEAASNWNRTLADDMTVLENFYHVNGHLNSIDLATGTTGTNTITLAGDFITLGAYYFSYHGRINLVMNGAADQTISNANPTVANYSYLRLNKSDGSVKLKSNAIFGGLEIPAGQTFDCSPDNGTNDYGLYVTASGWSIFTNAGTFYARSQTNTFGPPAGNGVIPFYNTGTFNASNSTTVFGGTAPADETTYYRTPLLSGGTVFHDVTIAMAANHNRKLLDDLYVNGNLVISRGDIQPSGTWSIYLTGDYTHSSIYTFGNSANLTLVMNGTNQTISQNSGTFSATLLITNGTTVALGTNLTTAASRYLDVATNSTFDLSGRNLTVGSGTTYFRLYGTLRLRGDEVTVTTPTLNSGCTVSYYGIDGTPVTVRNWAYKTLKLDGPGRE